MKALIVYTHPSAQSFNSALLKTTVDTLQKRGAEVRVKDLYAEGFNPVLTSTDFEQLSKKQIPADIAKEQQDVAWADHLVFIYPVWWWSWPALLKGWIDRVLLSGFAFRMSPDGVEGLLKHKKALVILTAGNPEETMRNQNALDPIERPMVDGTLRFCGIKNITVKTFFGVPSAPTDTRKDIIQTLETILANW